MELPPHSLHCDLCLLCSQIELPHILYTVFSFCYVHKWNFHHILYTVFSFCYVHKWNFHHILYTVFSFCYAHKWSFHHILYTCSLCLLCSQMELPPHSLHLSLCLFMLTDAATTTFFTLVSLFVMLAIQNST